MTRREQFNQVYLQAHRIDGHGKWLTDAAELDDDDIKIGLDGSGKPVAALLAMPYGFVYHGSMLGASAIKYVTTCPESRAKGAASHLIVETLAAARSRGDSLCVIVPPHRHLFFYYDRFSFATVFYVDEFRYTALHAFDGGQGDLVEPSAAILRGLELRNGCGTVHDDRDFARLRDEMSTRGDSHILAAADGGNSAILFACADDDNVAVRMLLADSEAVGLRVLAELRRLEPSKPFVVSTPPLSGCRNYLRSRGMARIVNPMPFFETLAAAYRDLALSIKVSDGLIADNCAVYNIAHGRCEKSDTCDRRPNLEVSIETLTALLFSSEKIGEIFGLPTRRPFLSII